MKRVIKVSSDRDNAFGKAGPAKERLCVVGGSDNRVLWVRGPEIKYFICFIV